MKKAAVPNLHFAAGNLNDIDLLQKLIDKGYDVNQEYPTPEQGRQFSISQIIGPKLLMRLSSGSMYIFKRPSAMYLTKIMQFVCNKCVLMHFLVLFTHWCCHTSESQCTAVLPRSQDPGSTRISKSEETSSKDLVFEITNQPTWTLAISTVCDCSWGSSGILSTSTRPPSCCSSTSASSPWRRN